MSPIPGPRLFVTCECGFQWFSVDDDAVARSIEVHQATCGQMIGSVRRLAVWPADPAHHCRENEPPQIPPPSRADADGKCSWNCRGSYSWNCYCPCLGERHGANHVWDPDERAKAIEKAIEDIYSKIERAKPRGDWPGRKST